MLNVMPSWHSYFARWGQSFCWPGATPPSVWGYFFVCLGALHLLAWDFFSFTHLRLLLLYLPRAAPLLLAMGYCCFTCLRLLNLLCLSGAAPLAILGLLLLYLTNTATSVPTRDHSSFASQEHSSFSCLRPLLCLLGATPFLPTSGYPFSTCLRLHLHLPGASPPLSTRGHTFVNLLYTFFTWLGHIN